MEKSIRKLIYGTLHYFEPLNEYQKISFTDVNDIPVEKEHF